jgi:hypothetical protein
MKLMDRDPNPPQSLEDLAWASTDQLPLVHKMAPPLMEAIREKLQQHQHDAVHNPKHYDLGGVQVIDIRDILLDRIQSSGVINYKQADYWSRSWEYMTRFMEKNGVEDLKKAKFYLDRLISNLESSK